MTQNCVQRIVVGVSRSAASRAALHWAAEEARLRKAQLQVVRAWDPARYAAPYAAAYGRTPTGQEEESAARDGLAALMHAAFGQDTPAGVHAELAEGAPERVLVDRSVGADLLVLGLSDPARTGHRFAGPVVRTCLERARCAVVVVSAADCLPASGGRSLVAAPG